MANSNQRFEEDVGNSLREINRQMTVLRDKNTKQALEIQRLKMKLQIAAELKGVSVDDLTAAMERVAMRDMGAEVRARLKEAERRAQKAELSKEEALALSREQQRAAQLELKIAEMTDRAKDFETMKAELMQRMKQQELEVQRLKRENDQLRRDVQNAKMESMDSNEGMDMMIQALQDQVHNLQNEQYEASQKASSAEMELTGARDRISELSLQRTKLTMLTTNQTELITDLQGQLDSMYAAYSMQEAEFQSIQDDYRTAQSRLEHSDMILIQINERIREEAQKQRDDGDIAAARALERLDIGALSQTPRNSVDRANPPPRVRAVARPAGGDRNVPHAVARTPFSAAYPGY